MPTLNAYVNDDGYYINARPSNIGNITYQLTSPATTFLLDLGYTDNDDLPWGIVSPLRSIGHIYTNKQGVSDGLNDESLDADLLPELSDDEARKLLAYLNNQSDVPDSILTNLEQHVNTLDASETTTPTSESPGTSKRRFGVLPQLGMHVELLDQLDDCTDVDVTCDETDQFVELTIELTMKYEFEKTAVFEETTTHTLIIANDTLTDWQVEPRTEQLSKLPTLYRTKTAIIEAVQDSTLAEGPLMVDKDARIH